DLVVRETGEEEEDDEGHAQGAPPAAAVREEGREGGRGREDEQEAAEEEPAIGHRRPEADQLHGVPERDEEQAEGPRVEVQALQRPEPELLQEAEAAQAQQAVEVQVVE